VAVAPSSSEYNAICYIFPFLWWVVSRNGPNMAHDVFNIDRVGAELHQPVINFQCIVGLGIPRCLTLSSNTMAAKSSLGRSMLPTIALSRRSKVRISSEVIYMSHKKHFRHF